jgi:hypothetical protein
MSTAEELTNWYLRLNGFLTIPNFILHPPSQGSQRTEADVVGIRFPFRKEFQNSDVDDSKLQYSLTKPSLFIVEVKTQEIELNDTWASSSKGNINKIMTDLGIYLEQREIATASDSLYESGRFNGEPYYCPLLFVGNIDVGRIPGRYLSVPRILWADVVAFIHQRFRKFARIKADNQQWDQLGKDLYNLATNYEKLGDFEKEVRLRCQLPAAYYPALKLSCVTAR